MGKTLNFLFTALVLHAVVIRQAGFSDELSSKGEIITNPSRSDGFGAQFQGLIYSVIYAELNGKEFLYTPFRSMEHNYDDDPHFLERKEQLINFIGNFEINENLDIQPPSHRTYYEFFENNLPLCVSSNSLKKIKKVFRQNKNKSDYFDDDHLSIAIHVRRPNSHDNRTQGPDIPDEVYAKIIKFLRCSYASQNPLFHIYSQGDVGSFEERFGSSDTVLHINESVEETFSSMVLADVLVTTVSSLSYVAGILSEGTVYYIPFWHPPLPTWTVLNMN